MRFYGTFFSSLLLHLSLVPLWIGSPIPFFYFLYLVYTGLCDFDLAAVVYGSLGVGAMAYLNWGRTFAYRPWAVELCYKLNMTAYYRECRLHGALARRLNSRLHTPFATKPTDRRPCGWKR